MASETVALLLRNCVVFHMPKTAGQWVAAALWNAGLLREQLGVIHASPDEIANDPRFLARPHRFTVVRHPLTWYSSMWAHRMDEAWTPIDDPDWFTPKWVARWAEFTHRSRSESFMEFVTKCLTSYRNGFVSSLYESYTQGCTQIARQESVVDDLIRILDRAGETFDEDDIRSTPPWNVRGTHKRWRDQCRYSPKLAAAVMSVERRAIEKFGYDSVPEDVMVTV